MTEQERRTLFFKVTGQVYSLTPMGVYSAFCKGLEAGYEAGRKDENEACAKVCDELADDAAKEQDFHAIAACESCAEEIRARGQE